MIDTHIHSKYSVDGINTLEEMALSAIDKGLDTICFTEHFDMNQNDDGYGYFREDDYFYILHTLQDVLSDRMTILIGIEFSEPHIYRKEFESFLNKGYDFILGSVHWIDDHWIGDPAYTDHYSIEDIFKIHYEHTVQACELGGFDSLAHMDFPKRYLLEKHEPHNLIEDAVKAMIKNDIAIEINTSPLRKGYCEYYPSDTILAQYSKHGGRYYTIGSDAHMAEDIAADFEAVSPPGLKLCYYQNRQRKFV